ncbi:hypothetical protein [Sphaerisporangium corydalis]|uniref:DUF2975 domain-containing protein n=1 Tax=Sphaerisporangium corydalis TaxID=1441875 RepID=A0ABV9EQY2_9ACTN|nr:hypothetical protein [Sphaerisporangium corydalis]
MNRTLVIVGATVTWLAGALAAVWGVAFAINGVTQAQGYVMIRVVPALGAMDRLRLTGEGLPSGVVLPRETMSLDVWGSTVAEQVLSRGDVLLGGLCAGVAGLLVRAVLVSVLRGVPFREGDPARIIWLAVSLVVAGVVGPFLPYLASMMVLERVGLTETFRPLLALSWIPVVGALSLLALAEVFRVGAKMIGKAGVLPGVGPGAGG